jgi:transmembrane protein EpsG
MLVFWINLAIVYLAALFARSMSWQTTIGPVLIRPNKLFVFFSLTSLVLVSGLRSGIGDTTAYMWSYSTNKLTWSGIDFRNDFGFNILQLLLQQISRDPQLLVLVTGLITNVLIVLVMYKYARLLEISLFVYIAGGLYTVTMNGIRQTLAAAIIFAAIKYLLNGNWKVYFLVVLFASTIHNSALLLIPIYFIARRKAWTKVTLLLIGSSIFIVLGFNQFMPVLFSVIETTRFSQYSQFSGGGANYLRPLIYSIPLILAFLGRNKLRAMFPNSDYIVNMSLMGLIFMIIATQQWIFARFTLYFSLYNIIIVSWVVKLFVREHQKLAYYGILCFYCSYYYFDAAVGLGLIYTSDYIKW